MKRWYHLAIAMAILVGLMTYLNFDIKKEETEKAKEEKAALLIGADYPWLQLQEISLATQKNTVTFAPVAKGSGATLNPNAPPEEWTWQIIKPIVTEAENSDVQNYLHTLKDLKVLSTIEENAEDLSIFGLEEKNDPLHIKLTDQQGKSWEVLLGILNPTANGNYMRFADSRKVQLVEQKLNYLATKKLDFYRAKSFFTFDNNEVEKITYRWQNQPEIILERKDRKWRVIAPLEAHGDEGKINTFLADLKSLRIEDYVSEALEKEGSKFGLAKPRGEMRLYLPGHVTPATTADGKPIIGKNLALAIGGETVGKDAFYVSKLGSPTVYKLQKFQLEKTQRDLSFFVDKALGNFVQGEINNIKYLEGNQPAQELALQSDGQWAIHAGDQRYLANHEKVQALLRKAKDLQAKTFLSTKPEKRFGLDSPTFQLILSAPAAADKPAPVYRTVFKRSKNAIYAQGGSDQFIFEIDESIFSALTSDLAELRERHPVVDAPNQKIQKLGIQIGNKGEVTLTRVQDRWQLQSKPEKLLPITTTAEALINQLYGLSVEQFVAPSTAVAWEKSLEKDLAITVNVGSGDERSFTLGFQPVGEQIYLNHAAKGTWSGYQAFLQKPFTEQLFKLVGLISVEEKK